MNRCSCLSLLDDFTNLILRVFSGPPLSTRSLTEASLRYNIKFLVATAATNPNAASLAHTYHNQDTQTHP